MQSEGPSRFFGDRPRESIANKVFGCRQKFFQKKFVIACHRMHTFTWLNLLLEPKRHLQRFGFVFLGTGVSLECKGSGWQAGERRPGRGDAACSPRTSRGESFGCKHFSKKFVIDCHWAHTFTWLNLLLEPKRHLQRFGFVYTGGAPTWILLKIFFNFFVIGSWRVHICIQQTQ